MSSASVLSERSLDGALCLLAERGEELTVLAGGTDLMVYAHTGAGAAAYLDISGLAELRGISEDGDDVVIGALTTFAEIVASPLAQRHLRALVQAARTVGAVQIQNRATIGGNFANASPAADSPPPVIAAGGSVELRSRAGRRRVDADAFFLGYKRLDRRPDELVASIRVPKAGPSDRDWFHKVGTRKAQAISKVVMAGRATFAADGTIAAARICAGSVAPTHIRLRQTEALLTGRVPSPELEAEVRRAAAGEVVPIDDIRSSAEYRRTVSGNLAARFVRALSVR